MSWLADFIFKLSVSLSLGMATAIILQSTFGEPLLTGLGGVIFYGLAWESLGNP